MTATTAFNAAQRRCIAYAALVWYGGTGALLIKTALLLIAARRLGAPAWAPALSLGAGLGLGLWRGRGLFRRVCTRNLARIATLEAPRPWHCYRPAFAATLPLMIGAGILLSHLARHHAPALLAVAVLTGSIAIALASNGTRFRRLRRTSDSR